MAKDDYFAIAYQLLKYLYQCLKAGKKPNRDVLCAEFFEINQTYWEYVIRYLTKDGYIKCTHYMVEKEYRVGMGGIKDAEITPKGIQYLEDNSAFQKVKGIVKDIAEIIPF
jgi:hypothetical protein